MLIMQNDVFVFCLFVKQLRDLGTDLVLFILPMCLELEILENCYLVLSFLEFLTL